ncbi:MAG: hypothetical protein U0575_16975 [Phycisphaerales bacterium]
MGASRAEPRASTRPSLTGEAVPIEAQPGTNVFAGTTNPDRASDVEVTAVASATTIGKIEALIRERRRAAASAGN